MDANGALSLPGQVGAWNELLMGLSSGAYYHESSTKPKIAGLKDGVGNATTVSFTFNTGANPYTTFAATLNNPMRTELHRDTCYVLNVTDKTVAYWQIAGLKPITAYTLKLFGYQADTGPGLFANFSATGLNTAIGATSLAKNYVDMVVTSTVSGQITGMLTNQTGQAGSSWSGMQIQGTQPFLLARDLISIDFEIADTAFQNGTASGAITDANGHTSLGQAGVWNSLLSGVNGSGNNQFTTQQPSISGLKDGEGTATTVAFQFNTGTPVSYYTYGSVPNVLHGDMFGILEAAAEASWQLSGLQPNIWYTLRMFGQQALTTPVNFATFTAKGNCSDISSTSAEKNYVDLTVSSTAAGVITGKLVWNAAGGAGSSWSGMQILKLERDPWVPEGTIIMFR